MNGPFRSSRLTFHASSEIGMALVLTLIITVLITAMVVEFAYGVYTATSALHNWMDSQRLSFVSKSGITLASNSVSNIPRDELFAFPGTMEIPVENILEGFSGSVVVTVEDENAKLNLNSLRNQASLQAFSRLIGNLGLNGDIAFRVANWIDPDSQPRLIDSKEGSQNAYLDSVDELLLIPGIKRQDYEALLPYVTVYGYAGTDDARINMNTAPIPVIMSLGISEDRAEAIVNYRKLNPFKTPGDLDKTGLDPALRTSISQLFTVGPPINFRIISLASDNGIKRTITGVVGIYGINQTVLYWREM